ncbi:cytochrome c [Wenzhouxiangella sp. AB-CW3]|uniref:c-type cytochrome n=1 Tax=Wenzhouxiangella sp. AB-CW3 TaxID=2771012 RepID=UPI00168B08C5|nr:cytochrome c [Wenzhouxiangella sp. AB-CW3]QOC22312.1 cytochrome c [Wenzhouxiangella sp. AB-CW3]
MTTHCKQTALAVLLASLLVAGCGQAPDEPVEMAHGQEPYLRYCASCHGNAGEGRPPAFPPLDESEWLELPPEGLALIVLYGLRGEIEVAGRTYRGFMPPMRNISDEDLAAIVAFMDEQWGDREPTLQASDVDGLRDALSDSSPLVGWDGVIDALEELE